MRRSEKGAVSSGSTCWLHGAEHLEEVIWTRVVSGDEETEGDSARRLWRSSWRSKSGRMQNSRIESAGFKTIQRGRKLKGQRKHLTPLDVGEDTVRHTVGRPLHGMTS